ncbi:MAG TPA: alpha-galactosidase [Bacteroidota bacterium]|nr:alpha-galactosidase [Bacteroidota bacterium]
MMRRTVLLVLGNLVAIAFLFGQYSNSAEIDNNLLKLSVNKSTRTWSLSEHLRDQWVPLISNASASLMFRNSDSLNFITGTGEISTTSDVVSDALGGGKSLTVHARGAKAEWNLRFTLYDFKRMISLSVSVKNVSSQTWQPKSLHVVDIAGAGFLGFNAGRVDVQCNGYQSWSACEIVPLDSASSQTSYWSMVFSQPDAFSSVMFGFITNTESMNSFRSGPLDPSTDGVHLLSSSDIRTVAVSPGRELHSDTLLIAEDSSPLDLLKMYGEDLQLYAPAIFKPFTPDGRNPVVQAGISRVPAGWCSWYYYYQNISEDSILLNLNSAAKNLRSDGLQYIQIDDGYQIAAGDWNTNGKFPHGHRWLVDQIHEKKMLAGLWVAPFAVAESSSVYKHHRDWLLKGDGDTLKELFANDWWGGRIFALDPTKREVQVWLRQLFSTIVNDWGYDYVKIDFLYFAGEAGSYSQPVSSARAYQMGLNAIRLGVGQDKFILGCGAPLGPSIGYVDGMRIGNDVFAGWDGIIPCVNAAAQRFSYHGTVWCDDPDCLVVRDPLTIDQGRAWASIVGLSGQMNLLSDKLTELPPERIDILERTLPTYGRSATPVDLFDQPQEEGLTISDTTGALLKLDHIWKIAAGDSMAYADPKCDDGSWKAIPVPSHWEDQGFPGLDGYVWYRLKFMAPASWHRGSLRFSFARIDDCDQTYLNGTLIGSTGDFPPNYNSEWAKFRVYTIPENTVNWGGENVLAVRVYDGGGPGGIYSSRIVTPPTVWNLPVEKQFEHWNVVGLFNWREEKQAVELDPARLDLSGKKSYLLYDFWNDKYLGELDSVRTFTLPPTSCCVLSVHERKDRPMILSTSRHVVNGGIDLVSEDWSEDRSVLSVTCEKLLKGEYSVVVYVPPDFKFKQVSAPVQHEETKLADSVYKITFPHIQGGALVYRVQFQQSEQ